jgi:hypothetical protein
VTVRKTLNLGGEACGAHISNNMCPVVVCYLPNIKSLRLSYVPQRATRSNEERKQTLNQLLTEMDNFTITRKHAPPLCCVTGLDCCVVPLQGTVQTENFHRRCSGGTIWYTLIETCCMSSSTSN